MSKVKACPKTPGPFVTKDGKKYDPKVLKMSGNPVKVENYFKRQSPEIHP